MKHLRVLLVSHETTLSGAPLALFHLASWLKRKGWELMVVAPERGPISDLLEGAQIDVTLEASLLTDPEHGQLREFARSVDVVVANTIAAWQAIRAAHRENVRAIWYLHETMVATDLVGKIPEIRPTLELADLLVTPTRATARVYQSLTRTPIEVIPYGIPDLGALDQNATTGKTRFLSLGTYEPRKGQDVLIRALGLLGGETRKRTEFTFAGRPLFPDFFRAVQNDAAQLPNVKLLTGIAHDDARRLMADADVLICASRDETMPIVIIEAMCLGRAIISTDVGGIAEWLRDGLNGLLVPKENADAMAEAITSVSSNPGRRRALAAAGRRTFECHFQVGQFAERFAAILESTTRSGGHPLGRCLVDVAPGPKATQRRQSVALQSEDEQTPTSAAHESYADWIREFDSVSASDRAALRRTVRMLRRQPIISVVMPVFNPQIQFLRNAIDSVKRQVYERWELCMADDASTDPATRELLTEAARSEPRIKLTFRETNGNISACSNSALALASGEWCALLDHDDELTEDALAMVAAEVNAHPDAGLIYADEDKIDGGGVRSNPFFKTDWNPELFLGQNYINHLGVYRTDLLRRIGGFREGFEGSQDYDLALRCIEQLRDNQIRHIPRILYHWRMAAGSLAGVVDAKPYARDAARRAIADHLRRREISGRVEPCPENHESHRVIYEIVGEAPLVSAIILTRDRAALLGRCIAGLRERTDYENLEIIVVDNASVESETHEFLQAGERDGHFRVLTDASIFNFSRLNNLAARSARGAILALINNDIEADDAGWLREMVSHAARPEVGAVGARLWYPDGTLQHGGVVLGLGGVAGHAHHRIPRGHPGYFNRAFLQGNYSAVTGACLLTRKLVFDQLGGFNDTDLAINFNDVDFCLRLRRLGLQVVWTPYANLIHHESATRGHHRSSEEQAQFAREASYMQRTWGGELLQDPFYNPSLALNLPGYELSFPPRRRGL